MIKKTVSIAEQELNEARKELDRAKFKLEVAKIIYDEKIAINSKVRKVLVRVYDELLS